MEAWDPRLEVVNVREFPLPGAARLFEMSLSDGTALRISTKSDPDANELGVIPVGADEAMVSVRLTAAEATTLASLLSGVLLVIRSYDDQETGDTTALRTVTIGAASPAVGRLLDELAMGDPNEARVVAVIRDDTRQLIEEDPLRRLEVGDRLVLVGRPPVLERVARHLSG